MLVCGIDIGSSSIEVLAHDGEQTVGSRVVGSGAFPAEQAKIAFEDLLSELHLQRSDVDRIVTTGFGRNYFAGADRIASEITCHALGVFAEMPDARTVIEIGGQDSKMMQLDTTGRVLEFVMNDRCAAGTGRFVETISRTLNVPIEETGPLGLTAAQACDISSMCAVFAESEIVGLLHQGKTPAAVLRGVFNSVARRILGMAGKIGLHDAVVFTGGVARNVGVHRALEEFTGHMIRVPAEPLFTGALGAAILGVREVVGARRITSATMQEGTWSS